MRTTVITKDTYIEDLVQEHPETVAVLMKHGIICIQCGEPIWGTLGEALDRAGIKEQDMILAELNEALNKTTPDEIS